MNVRYMRYRGPRLAGACCALGLALLATTTPAGTRTALAATAPPPSAIGARAAQWITVAPDYAQSGLVVVMATPVQGCKQNCIGLWVSHDGGATWSQSPAKSWGGGRPVIAVDPKGHDVLFASSASTLQESKDGGDSWTDVGPGGTVLPAISPLYSRTGQVALANPKGGDFLFSNGHDQGVTGSGGNETDLAFTYAPSYPSGGHYPPVLLSAADHNTSLPVIGRCDAQFSCNGGSALAGAGPFSAPATLLPSTDYVHDGVVFAQSGRGVYKSSDGATSFLPLALVPSNGAEATATPMMALAPGYKEAGPVRTAYVSVFQVFTSTSNPHSAGGVYATNDGGSTWHPLGSPSPLDGGSMALAVAPDGRLFAGYTSEQHSAVTAGLLCSQDGGATWHAACSPVHGPAAGPSSAGSRPCTGGGCAAISSPAAGAGATATTPGAVADAGHMVGFGGGGGTASGGGAGPIGVGLAFAAVLGGAAWYAAALRRRRRLIDEARASTPSPE